VRVSVLNLFSFGAKSSPILKDPKNATQHADHNTLLLFSDHVQFAISCPRIFKRGRVMTNLALPLIPLYKARLLAPFSMEVTKKSLKFSVSKSLSLWAVLMSLKYNVRVVGLSFLECRAH
jgi:hypothetical protein